MIFITAFPDDNVRARALDAGAVCFLTKPFDGPTLIKYLDYGPEEAGGGTWRDGGVLARDLSSNGSPIHR